MANSIALVKKYVDKLDDVYKLASLTNVLESDAATVRQGTNANEILIPKIDMDGMANYSRSDGCADGDSSLAWESVKFDYDRGRAFSVDAMDNEETIGISFGMLSSRFVRDKAVREFIMKFPKLKDGALLVDFLENSPIAYTVEPVPCNPVCRKFVDGSCEKQFLFLFASREFYNENVNQCIENLAFYEDFAEWICEQNYNENFPILSGNRTVIELEIVTGAYQISADTNTARYQIQMRLIYREN